MLRDCAGHTAPKWHEADEKELGGILGRKVELVFRSDVERSRNYLRREAVLKSAEVFY